MCAQARYQEDNLPTNTTPRRRMGEWRYGSTFLDLDTPLPLYPRGRNLWHSLDRAGLGAVAEGTISCPCRESNPGCPARSLVTVLTELFVALWLATRVFSPDLVHSRQPSDCDCRATPPQQWVGRDYWSGTHRSSVSTVLAFIITSDCRRQRMKQHNMEIHHDVCSEYRLVCPDNLAVSVLTFAARRRSNPIIPLKVVHLGIHLDACYMHS
jgi:hypothetical protein